MIKSVRLKNFKLFREAEIPLERLTVFVGPNGSGKTTVLDALYCLSRVASPEPTKVFNGRFSPGQLLRKPALGPIDFGCESSGALVPIRLDCSLLQKRYPNGGLTKMWDLKATTGSATVEFDSLPEDPPKSGIHTGSGPSGNLSQFESDCRYMRSALLLRLDPDQLAEPAESGSLRIDERGRGLSAVLQEMALNQPEEFNIFQHAVRTVIPGLQRVRMKKTTVQKVDTETFVIENQTFTRAIERPIDTYKLILDMVGATDVAGESASEGTLLVIGIMTVLTGPARPGLLLLDDIDKGLHPKAGGDLVQIIRTILDQYPDLQIVATSHSPYLLDHLKYEEVRLTSLDADGTARVGMLSDHPDFERWKDVMSPGEFWSTVGEKWLVADRKPTNA